MSEPSLTPAAITYQVAIADLHAHLWDVTLTLSAPAGQQEVALPAWIPGSYLVREFAKNLQGLQAWQDGTAVALTPLGKDHWRIACRAGLPLQLRYQVCAYDRSVRTAWLDATRGFFNPTSLCLRVLGQEEQAHDIELLAPENIAACALWQCATALFPIKTDARGFGRYRALSYDELADSPFELGSFWSAHFEVLGIPHRLVVAGAAPDWDSARLLADTQRICTAAMQFWHPAGEPAPFDRYLFLLNAVHDGYGGLEHSHSTALICSRRDLPRTGQSAPSEGYGTLLGLISHEYFHTWNVKRLRPQEFTRYDYQRENYTSLLWFFEGFTSYYDDLLLRRAGLLDDTRYLKLLAKTLQQVQQTPGRHVQSVAQASWDAWIKFYRPDENTANATVSYYTKGALVALCLDLALRRESAHSLDDVMRALWQRCQGGPLQESDLLAVLQQLSGRSWQAELADWVHGTLELPCAELLGAHGVRVLPPTPTPAQRLGLQVQENHSIQIKTVLRASPAEHAGFMAGDEWLGIEICQPDAAHNPSAWRLQRLDDLQLYAGNARQVTALVARDARLLRLTLELPAVDTPPACSTAGTWQLEITEPQRAALWLAPAAVAAPHGSGATVSV